MTLLRGLLSFVLLTSAGYAQDIRYNFASGVDFAKFKTYKWVQIAGAERLDQIADQQVRSAFDAELAKKGLSLSPGDMADLFIGYQVTLNQEKEVTMYDSGWGYGPGWYGYGGGGFSTATTSTIQIGQVDLDMYDPNAKQLVWRGSASKTLDAKAKPEKRQKNLAKGVTKLLKNYPPVKKG